MRHIHPKGDKPSLTQQQFKESVDVNNIVNGMKKGIMPQIKTTQPIYGDVSNVDYLHMLNTVSDVSATFNRLPAKLRAQFHNDPAQMLRWVNNPENREKAIKMGLIVESPQEPDYSAIMAGTDSKPASDSQNTALKSDPEANPRHDKGNKGGVSDK